MWDADRPKYAEQMTQLRQWLDDAKAKGIKKTFIVFHYPVFCRAGLGPIPEPDNPHKVIAATPRTWSWSCLMATSTRPNCMTWMV